MKKLILFLLLLFPFKVFGIANYIVMDMDSGRILEGNNIDSSRLIASITKIMTATIALEYGDIDANVKVDESIIKSYGSGIYIQVGEELTLDDLLYGLMLRSGNDAALQIASSVAGDISSFVYLMNEKAKYLGMNNTVFLNPTGLEENDGSGNTSTPHDMAILMRYAMNNENFRRYVSTKSITIKSSYKTYKWTNKNKLLLSYDYCTGGKTGYTKKAKRTLVTTASKDDMSLIVVTLNDGNDFSDHKMLYEKYFNNYKRIKVLDKNDSYGDNIYLKNDFYMISKDNDKLSTNVILDKGDFYNGDIVGKVEVLLNDEVIGFRYLYYRKEISTSFSKILKSIMI